MADHEINQKNMEQVWVDAAVELAGITGVSVNSAALIRIFRSWLQSEKYIVWETAYEAGYAANDDDPYAVGDSNPYTEELLF